MSLNGGQVHQGHHSYISREGDAIVSFPDRVHPKVRLRVYYKSAVADLTVLLKLSILLFTNSESNGIRT